MEKDVKPLQKIVLFTLLMAVFMLPPMLLFFNRAAMAMGIPVLYLYISVIWLLFIVCIALQARKLPAE